MYIGCIDPKLNFPALQTETHSGHKFVSNKDQTSKMCRRCNKTKPKDQFISLRDNSETTSCLRCRSVDVRYKHRPDRKSKKISKCCKTKSIKYFNISDNIQFPLTLSPFALSIETNQIK